MKNLDKILDFIKQVLPQIKQIVAFFLGYFTGKKHQKMKEEKKNIILTEERRRLIRESLARVRQRKIDREKEFKKQHPSD